MKDIVLLGSGGHAKSVVDIIEQNPDYRIIGFLELPNKQTFSYHNYRVLGDDSMLETLMTSDIRYAYPAMGYMGKGDIRRKMYERLCELGYSIPNFIDQSAILAKDVVIKENSGVFIGKRAVINSNARLEEMTIINSGAIIEHDCVVQAGTHVAVGAVVCGETHIGRQCLIGANATIKQCVSIGDKVIVGAGSVVLTDVSNNQIIYGNPAKNVMGNGDWA